MQELNADLGELEAETPLDQGGSRKGVLKIGLRKKKGSVVMEKKRKLFVGKDLSEGRRFRYNATLEEEGFVCKENQGETESSRRKRGRRETRQTDGGEGHQIIGGGFLPNEEGESSREEKGKRLG